MERLIPIAINSKNCNEPWARKIIEQYSQLIAERVFAFAKKGINQWQDNYAERNNAQNVTNTLLADANKNLVIMFDAKDEVVGGLVLKPAERPGYWDNGDYDTSIKAGYVTGLVSDPAKHGMGKAIMVALGEYAQENQIKKIRLDCKSQRDGKSFLDGFYESVGFSKVGGGYKEANEKFSDYLYSLYEATPEALISNEKTAQNEEIKENV